MTFRMRGHEEASGTKYVPKELFEEWGRKDPLKNFEQFLNEFSPIIVEMQCSTCLIAELSNGFYRKLISTSVRQILGIILNSLISTSYSQIAF